MMPIETATLLATSALSKVFVDRYKSAELERKDYTEKLETASGQDIFKYLLLINTAALDAYVAQTRLQAEQSFRLSKIASVAGFALLAAGVSLGMYSAYFGEGEYNAAYISVTSGALVEFVSGVFFYLYNRTLQQLNRFHDRLISSQHVSMSFLGTALISEPTKRDEQALELARQLMSEVATPVSARGSEEDRT